MASTGARIRLGGLVSAVALVLASAPAPAAAGEAPRYDVPRGYARCPGAQAWNGFFKWASVKGAGCDRAGAVVRAYARAAGSDELPRRAAGHSCALRTWRNADGDVYASRHVCRRGGVTVRFYGMV